MSTQILATKLYIPPPRPKAVIRTRLIERLNDGLHSKLMLISAPAGFGKTTLLSAWAASTERRVAWLSLDAGDNDLTRFLTHLVAALQTIAPQLGEGTLRALASPQPPPLESLLTLLLNDLTKISDSFVLILDDYHVMDSRPADSAITFLLEHLPPHMHLMIATRQDPQLPLARHRTRSQMTELRPADLRFTPGEAAEFLNQVMGLSLSADNIAALETRTEGWIAGLQLAALSMQGRQDTNNFIRVFAGSHHFVFDYLVEEVLQRQPENVHRFLLQTSILDKLNGSLCDAVTGQTDGRDMLEHLERGNLFVVPLDDQRQWYRYHHLFGDMLQTRLKHEQRDQVFTLHQRACDWYTRHDFQADAIRHALTGEDFERAAVLIEMNWPAMRRTRQEATIYIWMKALPEELFRNRPGLSLGYAWALLDAGEHDAAEARLRDAERWLEPTAVGGENGEMIVVDEQQFRLLPASIANARAYRAQALGDVPGTVKYTQQALDLLPAEDYYERGTAAALLGLAYWMSSDLEAAYQSFAYGIETIGKSGSLNIMLGAAFILASIRLAQGRLNDAVAVYENTLQFATAEAHGQTVLQGTAELYLGLGEMSIERGDIEAARAYLLKGKSLVAQASLPGYEYMWCSIDARLTEIDGDTDRALNLLAEAERTYYTSPIPDVRPVTALKVRLWIRHGKLDKAVKWVHDRGLSVEDDLSYMREFEHITLARLLIAQYRHDGINSTIQQAAGLLERLLGAAKTGGRMGSVIEILMLQTLAHEAQGDTLAALFSLERTLTLAEPQGYIQLFVDEGAPMEYLLREAAVHGMMPNYTHKLLNTFTARVQRHKHIARPAAVQSLIEPLSHRELEVLQHIAEGLTNQEIADRLFLSLNTVKVHARNIYDKLGADNRTQAVAKAREAGVLPRS